MIKELPLNDAIKLHDSLASSYLVFSGDTGIIYTGSDIPSQPVERKISVQEFRDRFTDAEMKAILLKGETDTNVELLLFKLQTVYEIDLDMNTVVNGINYLVSIGSLSQNRVVDILK